MKIRIFDILFSLLGLIILMPILIIIALLIKIDSKGPIIFKQARIGKNGAEFKLYKFRTMHVNSNNKQLLTVGNRDPRVTRLGYYLRKFKIDEIPQLINVLLGQMSIVGPRPEVKKYVDLYTPSQKVILSVKPGITDWASIFYSSENEILAKAENPEQLYIQEVMPHKINLNMHFIYNHTLKEYFRIIYLTILKISGKNIDINKYIYTTENT